MGAIFEVVDEATAVLERLASQFESLGDALINKTKASLAGFGKGEGLFTGIRDRLTAVETH